MPIKLKHNGAWHEIASLSNTTGTTKVAKVEDVKAYDEGGGEASPASKWVVRNLNTITDPHSVGITSTNLGRMSIPAGTYRLDWRAPAYAVKRHTSRLVYSTDSTLGVGNSTALYASSNYEHHEGVDHDQGWSMGVIPSVTFSSTTYFQIEHQIQSTNTDNDNGWGVNSGISGVDSIYTTLEVEDLSSAVLKSTSTGTTKVATVKDVKAWNVDGGAASTNAWITRDLNTISDPYTIGLSVSANVITVPAGTYSIRWSAPAWRVRQFTSKVEYSTDSTFATGVTSVQGSNSFASNASSDGTQSQTLTIGTLASVTFSATTYVRIRQWNAVAKDPAEGDTDNALGVANGVSGAGDSVYTTVVIEDLATAVKDKASDGKVINVWNVTYDGKQLIDTEDWEDISDLTVTLTPQSASSKFLITAVVNAGMNSDGDDCMVRLVRGSTVIGSINAEYDTTHGTRTTGFGQIAGQQGYTGIQAVVITYLDTPNTTSPLTYHIEGINLNNGHNLLINYRGAGTFTTTSHMTITELRP